MNRFATIIVACVVASSSLGTLTSPAVAQSAVEWRVADGGNGHWYQRVTMPSEITWTSANAAAVSQSGYLVSINSAAEQSWVFQTLVNGQPHCQIASWAGKRGIWLGLFQNHQASSYSEPSGGWEWSSGEPVSYTNWNEAEPNNVDFPADFAGMYAEYSGTWDDTPNDTGIYCTTGFAIEWSADCNSDGVVDYGQIASGELADANSNNIPDCCEQGTPCGTNLMQNGGFESGPALGDCTFGTHYAVSTAIPGWIVTAGNINRTRTSTSCEFGVPGWGAPNGDHSIDLDGDNHTGAIAQTIPTTAGARYRLSFALTGNCGWEDQIKPLVIRIDGIPHEFEHACTATMPQPWNTKSFEFVALDGQTTIEFLSPDLTPNASFGPVIDDVRLVALPPSAPLHVPSEYATIQGAINAAPAGEFRTVLVAAGTYTEHISFNGKNVVVRGAGSASTIIDGTGPAQSSVVRFSGAEPATAALEGVTVRGGITGTPFPTNPSVLVGGGIFGYNSAASVRNCVIEQNLGGFGGGAYLFGCTGQISQCTIRNNSAGADGGGLQIYGGAMTVVDCTIAGNYTNSRGAGAHVVLGVQEFTRVAITGNYSNNAAGGLSWVPDGGVLAHLTLDDCTVTGNTAEKVIGGIGAVDDGGGPKLALLSTLVCSNTPMPNAAGPFTADSASEICDCRGDVIQDGLVNGVDLAAVLTAWGTSGGPTSRADCNRDGIVGGPDLTIVLSGWGVCP